MKRYRVELSAKAYVSGSIEVRAQSAKDAEKQALNSAWAGEINWKYNGTEDDTAQVEGVTEL